METNMVFQNTVQADENDTSESFVLDLLKDLVRGKSEGEKGRQSENHGIHRIEAIPENIEESEYVVSPETEDSCPRINPSFMKRGIYSEIAGFCSHTYEYKSNPIYSETPYSEYLEEILLLGDDIFYCFTDEGLLLSKERLTSFVCMLGKTTLQKPGLISTGLGIDAFMIAMKTYIEVVNPEYKWSDDASTILPPIEADISSLIIELDGHEFCKSHLYKMLTQILHEMAWCFSGGKFENINGVQLSYLAIALNYFIESILGEYEDISQTLLELTTTICKCINTKFFALEDDV